MKLRAARTPVAIVIVAVFAVAYAYLVDRGRVSDSDREERVRDVFPSFRVDAVTRVEIVHPGETVVLERERGDGGGSTWAMRSPHAGATDAAAVDALLRDLETAPRVRGVSEDIGESRSLGLDTPRAKGRIAVGSLVYEFALGNDAPRPAGAAYMRIEGEGTFVVGRAFKAQLLKNADAYRDHALVPVGASDVVRLEVRRATGPGMTPGFTVVRKEASFRVGDLDGLRASRATMDKVFGALADARVDSFVADADADRASGAPALTVDITTGGAAGVRLVLAIGGPCPSDARDVVAVRTEPSRLGGCVAKRVADALGVDPEALVDRAAFFAHPDEMEEVRFQGLSGPKPAVVDLARRGTGWHERSPEDRDLVSDEVDAANALTLALASVDGSSPHRIVQGEVFAPRWRATVFRTAASAPEVVEVSAPIADHVVVRRAEDGALLRVDRASARVLEARPIAVRSLAAARLPVDPGAVVAIDDTCTAAPERLDLVEGTWRAKPPGAFDVDPVAVSDLLGGLARARATAWLAADDDGTFGFGSPGACKVTVTVHGNDDAETPRRFGIAFAPATRDARDLPARDLGDPAVFLAPAILREMASRPAVDRSRFRIDSGAVARVTLVRGAEHRLLVRARDGSDRLVRAGGSSPDASDDALDAGLGALYAQSAVHLGPAAEGEGLDHPLLEILVTPSAPSRPELRLTFGAPVQEVGVEGYYARASGVDATFLVPRRLVDAILAAW